MKIIDKIKVGIWLTFLISFLAGLTYSCWFSDILLNMFRLTYLDYNHITIWNHIALLAMILGLIRISNIYYNVITRLFYPRTDFQKKCSRKRKELRGKYSRKYILSTIRKMEYEHKLEKINKRIRKYNE